MQFHTDVIAPVILGTTSILFFAVLGRFAARRLGQPSVLGELLMGILIGTLGYVFSNDFILVLREGPALFNMVDYLLHGEPLKQASEHALGEDYFKVAQTVDIFSRYGIIFMLFLVGLETSLGDLRRVGMQSTLVASIGVIAPFVLGLILTILFLPDLELQTDLFIAATLIATSVGITARRPRRPPRSWARPSSMMYWG